MKRIDLNADMGESAEALRSGRDAELMRWITSANVACGGHAGDDETMRQTMKLAKHFAVAVGAHPSYPDPENFGRVEMVIVPEELEIAIAHQLSRLWRIAQETGVRVRHVKPHGALYHAAGRDPRIAQAIANAVREFGDDLVLVGQAGSMALKHWQVMGFRTAAEAFADRAYEATGELRKRTLAGALLDPPQRAAEQARTIVLDGAVTASTGERVAIEAETLCIHSDTPGSAEIARQVRQVLENSGVEVRSLG